jgi:glycosyltransferase involved in cell wall biosynthesis
VPTKLYEYLAASLAVLSTPLPRVADLLDGSGAGVLVSSDEDAAAALRAWAADPASLAAARTAARSWADRELRGATPYDDLARELTVLSR